MNNQTLPLRAGCRGRQPLHLVQANSLCRKIATLFANFTLCYGMEKAVQSFVLRHRFVLITTLYFFFAFSAPLGRLTPIEALPQAPQGTLSLDPASPLTPGLSLRFTSRSARCWISHSGQLCQFLIPHSSFFISTSFLHNTNTPITFGTAISPLKISDTPHTSSMLHIVPMHPQAIAMIL